MNKKSITVCTPSYNRQHTLKRLYESLKNQTFKDFEWIIVDDGSIDNTKELIDSFINENIINIQYFHKKNGGKHRAVNYGVQKAKGELFAIVDSDDFLVNNALEILMHEKSKNLNFEIFISLDKNHNDAIIGDSFPDNLKICNINKLHYNLNLKGDKWIVASTKVMKEFPFPEFENENFIAESSIWMKIAEKYDAILINLALLVVEYQETGLSANNIKLRQNSPYGTSYIYLQELDLNIPLKYKIKAAINLFRFSYVKPILLLKNILKVNPILTILALPLSLLFIIKDWKN